MLVLFFLFLFVLRLLGFLGVLGLFSNFGLYGFEGRLLLGVVLLGGMMGCGDFLLLKRFGLFCLKILGLMVLFFMFGLGVFLFMVKILVDGCDIFLLVCLVLCGIFLVKEN